MKLITGSVQGSGALSFYAQMPASEKVGYKSFFWKFGPKVALCGIRAHFEMAQKLAARIEARKANRD